MLPLMLLTIIEVPFDFEPEKEHNSVTGRITEELRANSTQLRELITHAARIRGFMG